MPTSSRASPWRPETREWTIVVGERAGRAGVGSVEPQPSARSLRHGSLSAANREPFARRGVAETEVCCEAAISRYTVGFSSLRARRLAILASKPIRGADS